MSRWEMPPGKGDAEGMGTYPGHIAQGLSWDSVGLAWGCGERWQVLRTLKPLMSFSFLVSPRRCWEREKAATWGRVIHHGGKHHSRPLSEQLDF